MAEKKFKTLDEQIEILKNKGLVIDDVETVRNILLRENYFFISGYRHIFLKSPTSKSFINLLNVIFEKEPKHLWKCYYKKFLKMDKVFLMYLNLFAK